MLEVIMVPIDYNERKMEDLLYYLCEKLSWTYEVETSCVIA